MARTDILQSGVELGVHLDRYQELMRLPLNAFNGVNRPEDTDTNPEFFCTDIWKQRDRDALAEAIAEAEEMRHDELGYYTFPRYTSCEELNFEEPLELDEKYLIKVGEQTIAAIQAAVALDHGVETSPNDPVEISIAVTFTDTDELKVFYPGESVEIHPSSISISGGTATIKIPRGRLVDPDVEQNSDDSINYYENDNFLSTVDLKRVYYDESKGLYIITQDCNMNKQFQTARAVIRNNKLSIIDFQPASYSGGSWTVGKLAYGCQYTKPYAVRVKFVSGIRNSQKTEKLTIRLAHTLMPFKPVDCEAVAQYWQEDREVSRNPVRSGYGMMEGALATWIADSRKKVGAGGGMLK